jgi:two-component system sensor histidine kinase FlrB
LYAGQLAKGGLNGDQRCQFSAKLLAGLRHTETLVGEMLAFSRGGNFSSAPIALRDVVRTAVAGLAPRVRQLEARLFIDIDELADSRVRGNLDALAGALSNLIDNALDHAGAQACVRVSGQLQAAGSVELLVEDNGPGIDPQVLSRIFDPFFTTRERGTGLGLAVVQAVVLEHDGSITAGTSALGGARFDIQLPALRTPLHTFPNAKTGLS